MRAIRRSGRRRASLGGLISDIMDATHDYADDWIDRFDDFEDDMRDAFDDLAEDRDYWYDRPYGRYGRLYDGPYRRPVPARPRPEAVKEVLDKTGLKDLAEKVESLSKTVEQLVKAKAVEG